MEINSWSVFDYWTKPADIELKWDYFDNFVEEWLYWRDSLQKPLAEILRKWDGRLKPLGGDPSHTAWSNFRLLRLHVENDWSDMLAWLFSNSKTGIFAKTLLDIQGRSAESFAQPSVDREYSTDDGYRADLVIEFKPTVGTVFFVHIEVKIDDADLAKTPNTGKACFREKGYPSEWHDYILMKRTNTDLWQKLVKPGNEFEKVTQLYWEEVAIALRQCLWLGSETLTWRVWALTLCGSIEEKILHLRYREDGIMVGIEEKLVLLEKGSDENGYQR